MRFQDGCENNLSLNQLDIMVVEEVPEERETDVFEIPEIPEEKVKLEKVYYLYFCVMLRFKK